MGHVTMQIGFVVNRLRGLRDSYTTTRLAVAALKAGHGVLLIEMTGFTLDPKGRLLARSYRAAPQLDDPRRLVLAACEGTLPAGLVDLEQLDGILLRNNPVRHTVLDFARLLGDRGVTVLNDPDGIAAGASKTYLAELPAEFKPQTVVTRDRTVLQAFLDSQGGRGVLKPVRGFGGRGVVLIEPGNKQPLDEALEATRGKPDAYLVLQEYLPRTREGDKRILLVDGEPVGCYVRMRRNGEFRHNLHVGGRPVAADLSDRDRQICRVLAGKLRADGIFLAGLDVIGGLAVEVNMVAPGGVANIERTTGRPLADAIVEKLATRLQTGRRKKQGSTGAHIVELLGHQDVPLTRGKPCHHPRPTPRMK